MLMIPPFLCADLISAEKIIDTFNVFSTFSGLKVNTDKCEIVGIGVNPINPVVNKKLVTLRVFKLNIPL